VVRLGRGYFKLVEKFIVVSVGVLFAREMRGAKYGRVGITLDMLDSK